MKIHINDFQGVSIHDKYFFTKFYQFVEQCVTYFFTDMLNNETKTYTSQYEIWTPNDTNNLV
jgi:hypothetical protein